MNLIARLLGRREHDTTADDHEQVDAQIDELAHAVGELEHRTTRTERRLRVVEARTGVARRRRERPA